MLFQKLRETAEFAVLKSIDIVKPFTPQFVQKIASDSLNFGKRVIENPLQVTKEYSQLI
jgi:hypothetical protein